MEDWDGNTYERFVANVKKYKATAEAYQSVDAMQEDVAADAYQVTFVSENGQAGYKEIFLVLTIVSEASSCTIRSQMHWLPWASQSPNRRSGKLSWTY